jgi:phosphoheptose isomerase
MGDDLTATTLARSAQQRVAEHIRESIKVKEAVIANCTDDIIAAAELIAQAMTAGGKLLICGNGGSAADSQHIAAEFVSILNQDFQRPGLPAIALTTDSSMLTAYANDFGFEGVFARQVQALGRPGDAVLGITTSGNSANVLRAVEYARSNGMRAIGLTGSTGGKLRDAADITIRAPSSNTQHVQEAHIAIGHIICDLVEQAIFAAEATR